MTILFSIHQDSEEIEKHNGLMVIEDFKVYF